MKISVVGTGYVGLVSGVCLAEKGHEVICVDKDSEKISQIQRAISPIHESGLDELLERNIDARLRATTDLRAAVMATDVSIIAVGTPFDGSEIDITYVRKAAEDIGEILRDKDGYHVVLVKSTVVPGTTDEVVVPILEQVSGAKAGRDFGVGMNPEFLREGEAVRDFMSPDRIVLGALDDRTTAALLELYLPFHGVDIVKTNNKTAEMIKYASNSLLATMISFSNEIGNLCAAVGGVDVVEVMKGVHLDRRLSPLLSSGERIMPSITTYLEAGCGFGGSCFPKDVKALIAHGQRHNQPMRILEAVIQTNKLQPEKILTMLAKHFPSLNGVRVGILGLAFKPGTDDMRESPAIPIVKSLLERGAKIRAYDPIATKAAEGVFNERRIRYCDTLVQAISEVDAVVLLTRWPEFAGIPELLKEFDPAPLLVDGRRMIDKSSVMNYEGVGL